MTGKKLFEKCYDIHKKLSVYTKSFLEYYKQQLLNCTVWEYAIGGQSLHRGYYYPSSIIICTNQNRGKKATKIPQGKSYYRYGFNSNHKMLIVDQYAELNTHEFLIHENDKEFSIVFRENGGILNLYECCYNQNNQLSSYISVNMMPYIQQISSCDAKFYSYENSATIIDSYLLFCFYEEKIQLMFEHERYTFLNTNNKSIQQKSETCIKPTISWIDYK